MATATMEQTIAALERAGWRLQNLSHAGAAGKWSCILEQRKLGRDGYGVFASSPLSETPAEALDAAWRAAQAAQAPGAIPPAQLQRLKVAVSAARAALATSDDADDTF